MLIVLIVVTAVAGELLLAFALGRLLSHSGRPASSSRAPSWVRADLTPLPVFEPVAVPVS